MIKHYLTAALRHFMRHKVTTAINVACLTIGLVCFLAISAMVTYLSSGDKHFENSDRIYFISQGLKSAVTSTFSSPLAAERLRAEFPEFETVARATFNSGVGVEIPVTVGDRKVFAYSAYADPEFLEVFALPFLSGDSRNALRAPRSAVISKDLATRLFGDATRASGQSLRLQDGTMLTVRGVVGDLKTPSHIVTTGDDVTPNVRFDVLISMDVLESTWDNKLSWLSGPFLFTYVVLPKDGSFTVDALRSRLRSFAERHANSDGNEYVFDAVAVNDYWLSGLGSISGTDKDGPTMMFYFLGIVVLFISCLNYANLATAQAASRAKEIGMRRTMGAHRRQIIGQFMMEASLLSFVALACALAIVAIGIFSMAIPGAANIVASATGTLQFWILLVSLLAIVTLAAGLYPAFVLSAVRPQEAIRTGKSRSGGRFVARLLVGLQFAGASFLLIAMLVMGTQNRMLQRSVFGDSAETWVAISNNMGAAGVKFESLRTELMERPHIKDVTAVAVTPWAMITLTSAVAQTPSDGARAVRTARNHVNHDFFSTLDIKLLAGRAFDRDHAGDNARDSSDEPASQANIVIDQALAEANGWLRPDDAVGRLLYAVDDKKNPMPRSVVGVVANKPMSVLTAGGSTSNMYLLDQSAAQYPIVRIDGKEAARAIKEIETAWNTLAPSVALKLRFADELMNRNYQSFKSIETTFGGVATLALLISVLGLIGISLNVIGRRRHEIGVRKSLGASVLSIVRLLLTDFSKPVIVANLLAWPIGFVAMNFYLSMFSQRTSLSATPFIASLTITVLIAWIAVAAQATRAARLNPATVLRYE